MALNYKRFSEEDIQRLSILAAGEYQFYVSSVKEEKSKGGVNANGEIKKIYDMLAVELKLFNEMGQERTLKDWVLLVQEDDKMGFKFRHFAETCGLLDKYESGTLDARDFLNKKGVVKIGVRDYTDQYGEKKKQNSVIDYIKPSKQVAQSNDNFIDDEIKF